MDHVYKLPERAAKRKRTNQATKDFTRDVGNDNEDNDLLAVDPFAPISDPHEICSLAGKRTSLDY